MKVVSLAILAITMVSTPAAFASPPLTEDSVSSATFEEWHARQKAAPAVLEIDMKTGEVEASEDPVAEELGGSQGEHTAQVPIPGEPNAVVETPQESTDVPDDARAQILADPNTLEEAEKQADNSQENPDPFLIRLQILLDRAHASPGVIDGFLGENTRKAIAAYEEMRGLPVDGEPDAEVWAVLAGDSAHATQTYEIIAEDINGRYVETIPDDYAELARLEWLGYHDVVEMLAEKFHMDGDLLRLLNPKADFGAAGTKVIVAAVGPEPTSKVARVIVDKSGGELRAYDPDDNIVFASPATIGSAESPSPAGTLTVATIAPEPTYSYDPSNFQQGNNREPLTLPPGPNGPVGNMWIGLSQPTFGIHGTADPEMIDKSQSNGCVRLTNWDANTLAELVEPDRTVVEFRD